MRDTNLLKSMQMVHWKNLFMRGFSLLGEFIIGCFTVFITFLCCLALMNKKVSTTPLIAPIVRLRENLTCAVCVGDTRQC